MRLLKITTTDWIKDSRDVRELAACRELGMEVAVMAKGMPYDDGRKDSESGFDVYRFSTRPLGTTSWLNPFNRVLSLWIWGRKAARFKADIISGHDMTGLLIGYLCNIGRRYKAKLVYDSHEFELGRNQSRSAFKVRCVSILEKFLMKRSAFSIMVNDSIADEVQRIHCLDMRPVVVRNVPPYWTLDKGKTAEARRELLAELHAPEDTFLVLYHGSVTNDRGVENMLRAVAKLPGTAAVVLGNGQPEYLATLHTLAEELGVADRTLFHAAVPYDILRNYVSAVDVGVVTVLPTYKSYYFMLPNKFFECIQSETPVIVSDFPEVGRITDHYGIGLKVNPADAEAIAAGIHRLRTDKEFYGTCKTGLARAKEDLCWEKEKPTLSAAYRALF